MSLGRANNKPGRFVRAFKRISRVGTWESLKDAAIYIATVLFASTMVIDIIIYAVFCGITDRSFTRDLSSMDSTQTSFLISMAIHVILATTVITIVMVTIYNLVISRPVKSLMEQIKDMDQGEMTDYLISGKMSKPFASVDTEETWLDMVRSYVDVASSEKFLDELTGCFNRKYFSQVLVNYMRMQLIANPVSNSPKTYDTDVFAVFLIDIDHFKSVNDTYGHAAGDDVLRQVGRTLRNSLKDTGVVIRNGGEEFLVVASAKFPFDFGKTAELINQAFRDHITVTDANGGKHPITCSIGFVSYPFYDPTVVDLSLQHHVDLADQAMYLSKMSGRDTWHELISKNVPSRDFDLNRFCSACEYGIQNGYISVRKAG